MIIIYFRRIKNNKDMLFRVKLILTLLLLSLVHTTVYSQGSYEPVIFNVSSFEITGDNPIGDKAFKVLQPFLGEQSGLEGLSAAADALERAIISAGFSFHRVSLPPQQLTSGTVEFQVVSFSIGSINISGNEYFDEQNINNSLPLLKTGSTPNTKELSRSLKLANNHASKNIVLKFKEGESEDAIDAELTVQDQNPQLVFITLDNTGSADSEEFRSTVGYQHGNLFNLDHSITATFTVAPQDTAATAQVGFNYHVPLYAHGANMDFLFSDSEVNSGDVADGAAITGKGSVMGFTYSRPLLTDTNFNHQWSAGFQAKSFDNEIDLGGGSLVNSKVLSAPLELGYGFSYNMSSGVVSGGLKLAMNLDAGKNNSDEDYAAVRPEAQNDWTAVSYHLSYDLVFAQNWLFHAGMSGQNSSDLLIPGEQFGVGGSSSLRGFEERSVTGDTGYQTSLELWLPAIFDIRFLLFVDQASLDFNSGELSEGDSYDLSSAGFGMRWSWKQNLSISLDYGVINEGGGPDTTINQDGDSKAHFNLVYRF
ncbi:MAG: ShlB/FhaC/HecB family hemolysin secretion/activation protein [Gammaproteobacteria bacterium]|nr:ShlB/FhaC/HecB family hemolysin secretion/activation protein [Gammaproteobacteria bacterium]